MSWGGVKNQINKVEIKAWCEEMNIKNYTINPQGEIDVDEGVNLSYQHFKELPYKFGRVSGYFNVDNCKNLISLKNCPDYVGGYFSCDVCSKLNSLEGCPKEVVGAFYCYDCKHKFTKEYVISLCKVAHNKVDCRLLQL